MIFFYSSLFVHFFFPPKCLARQQQNLFPFSFLTPDLFATVLFVNFQAYDHTLEIFLNLYINYFVIREYVLYKNFHPFAFDKTCFLAQTIVYYGKSRLCIYIMFFSSTDKFLANYTAVVPVLPMLLFKSLIFSLISF